MDMGDGRDERDYLETWQVIGENYYDEYFGEERWSEINGFPGYFISTYGRVFSRFSSKHQPRFLKPYYNVQNGYLVVDVRRQDRSKAHLYIHRLLAEHFTRNEYPEEYNIVRHLDDIRDNNDLDNLKWGTTLHNHNDMRNSGNMYSRPVIIRDLETDEEMYFHVQAEAADFLGVSRASICLAARNGKIINNRYEVRRAPKRYGIQHG